MSFQALCWEFQIQKNLSDKMKKKKKKKHNLPLRSAAPPLMIRATITAPVASSRLMVAPWNTDRRMWSLTGQSYGLGPCFPCSLFSTLSHDDSPEAPCSSPAWQSSLTLPPGHPRSHLAAVAARGQSSSEPQCRALREQPDGKENGRAAVIVLTSSCCGAQRAAWNLSQFVRSLRDTEVTVWCQSQYNIQQWNGHMHVFMVPLVLCLPWDGVRSAGAAAPSPQCSSVRSAAPLPPADYNTHMNHEPWPRMNLCMCMSVIHAAVCCKITADWSTDVHTMHDK